MSRKEIGEETGRKMATESIKGKREERGRGLEDDGKRGKGTVNDKWKKGRKHERKGKRCGVCLAYSCRFVAINNKSLQY